MAMNSALFDKWINFWEIPFKLSKFQSYHSNSMRNGITQGLSFLSMLHQDQMRYVKVHTPFLYRNLNLMALERWSSSILGFTFKGWCCNCPNFKLADISNMVSCREYFPTQFLSSLLSKCLKHDIPQRLFLNPLFHLHIPLTSIFFQ